jgi:hypothetical protein
MKSMMEIASMFTNFVSEKVNLLSSVPLFIAMPIRSVFKKIEDDQSQVIESEQKLEGVCNHKGSRHTKINPKPKNIILSLWALIGCVTLSSCTGSTYSSHFDCPVGEGAGCASISRVNKMIDRREIDLNGDDVGAPVTRTPVSQVYVYYGPNQLSRLIPADSQEGK